jgi:hypothetical protein
MCSIRITLERLGTVQLKRSLAVRSTQCIDPVTTALDLLHHFKRSVLMLYFRSWTELMPVIGRQHTVTCEEAT